jgi:hypothetical protein
MTKFLSRVVVVPKPTELPPEEASTYIGLPIIPTSEPDKPTALKRKLLEYIIANETLTESDMERLFE